MKTYPGTSVSSFQSPKTIKTQRRLLQKSLPSMVRLLTDCDSVGERKEVRKLIEIGKATIADLHSALPMAEKRERDEIRAQKKRYADALKDAEAQRKERIAMARKAKKAAKKAEAKKADKAIKKAKTKTEKKGATRETYQDSILIIVGMAGKDMGYAAIQKQVIARRVAAGLMDEPKGPNGACGAALKKLVNAGILTQPARGVYAAAKA